MSSDRSDSLDRLDSVVSALTVSDFEDFRRYHEYNILTPDGSWVFNGVDFGEYQPTGKKNKDDYTRELVFCYLEWLYSCNCLESISWGKKRIEASSASYFWNEPSAGSLNLYPLLWAIREKKYNKEFVHRLLEKNYQNLLGKIEFGVGANHLIDNFLSLSIYSLLFGRSSSPRFFFAASMRLLMRATSHGYYAEKTPIYALGLAIRLNFVWSILSRHKCTVPHIQDVRIIIAKLLNYPEVQLNDSYLPTEVLKFGYQILKYRDTSFKTPEYYIHDVYSNYKATLVTNGVGARGYRAHGHDSSMSLFVEKVSSGEMCIAGFGTPEYANTQLRVEAKQHTSYPSVKSACKRQLKCTASFRSGKIYQPDVEVLHSSVVDKNSKLSYRFDKSSISIRASSGGQAFVFSFWSPSSRKFIGGDTEPLEFKGYLSYELEKSCAYNGIYRSQAAWIHRVRFLTELELRFHSA